MVKKNYKHFYNVVGQKSPVGGSSVNTVIKTNAPTLRFQSLFNQLKKQNKKDLLQGTLTCYPRKRVNEKHFCNHFFNKRSQPYSFLHSRLECKKVLLFSDRSRSHRHFGWPVGLHLRRYTIGLFLFFSQFAF